MDKENCLNKLEEFLIPKIEGRRPMVLELNHSLFLYKSTSQNIRSGLIVYVRFYKDPKLCPKGRLEFGTYKSVKDNSKFKKSKAQEFTPREDLKDLVIATLFSPKIAGFDFGYSLEEMTLNYVIDDTLNIIDCYSSHFEDVYRRVYKPLNGEKPLKTISLSSGQSFNESDVMKMRNYFEDYDIRAFLTMVDKKFLKYIDTKGARSYVLRFYNTFKTFVPVFIFSRCVPNPLLDNPRMRNIVFKSQLFEDAKRHEVVIGNVHIFYCTELVLSKDLGLKKPSRMQPKLLYELMMSLLSSSLLLPSRNVEFFINPSEGEILFDKEYSALPSTEKIKYVKTNALREKCNNYYRILGYSSVEDMYSNLESMDFIGKEVV